MDHVMLNHRFVIGAAVLLAFLASIAGAASTAIG